MAGTLTHAEIDKLRHVLTTTREVLASVVGGEVEVDKTKITETIAALDEAIASTDPERERRPSDVGARVLEAASDVGIDQHRLDVTIRTMVPLFPTGALTRILFHELKKTSFESLDRIADMIGCEREWLHTGKGEKRTKPIPSGVVLARGLGASESAIGAVLERDKDVGDRDEQGWCMAFLQETKVEQSPEGVPAADAEDHPSSVRVRPKE